MIASAVISNSEHQKAVCMMLATAAHFRKIGNYVAARRAINTLKSWRA